ncbi:hypothetical protein BH11ACT8_BH11ACT8_13850 [soil metagenome]
MTSSTLSRRSSSLLAVLVLGTTGLLSGCDLEVGDTPLGASADQRGTALGDAVTGSVENPDGEITVTLAPAAKRLPEGGANSTGSDVTACDYADTTFSCPTAGLTAGLYRVEVTDAKFASEGTKLITVALSADGSYAPRVQYLTDDPGSTPRRAALELVGWRAGSTVKVFLQGSSGRHDRVGTVTIGADGTGQLIVQRKPSPATVLATDGLWDDRTTEGWDREFINAR